MKLDYDQKLALGTALCGIIVCLILLFGPGEVRGGDLSEGQAVAQGGAK